MTAASSDATPGKPGVVIDRIAYSAYGEATRTLRSDVNGDGFVNKDDYNGVIRSRLNTTIGSAGYVVEADLDRDGKVAQSDYDIAVADDGKSSSGGVGEAGLFAKGVRNGVGYCGYMFNDESGLYTVRYRTYSPTLGRWLERDPAGYVDGMGLYVYVRGGPIRGGGSEWALDRADKRDLARLCTGQTVRTNSLLVKRSRGMWHCCQAEHRSPYSNPRIQLELRTRVD
jgi:RHS repeat-associated protein